MSRFFLKLDSMSGFLAGCLALVAVQSGVAAAEGGKAGAEAESPKAVAEGMYDRLDRDHDGFLSHDELERAMNSDGFQGMEAAIVFRTLLRMGDKPGAK